jgi:hypothetical protein
MLDGQVRETGLLRRSLKRRSSMKPVLYMRRWLERKRIVVGDSQVSSCFSRNRFAIYVPISSVLVFLQLCSCLKKPYGAWELCIKPITLYFSRLSSRRQGDFKFLFTYCVMSSIGHKSLSKTYKQHTWTARVYLLTTTLQRLQSLTPLRRSPPLPTS